MAASETPQGLCALEHRLVTYGTVPLQALGYAVMLIPEGNAGIAPHAVPVVHSQSSPRPADVAERTVVYRLAGGVIVEVAYAARVPGEGPTIGGASGVDTPIPRRLEGPAAHAKDLMDLVPVQGGVLVLSGHFARLLAAEAAGVEPPRRGVAELA